MTQQSLVGGGDRSGPVREQAHDAVADSETPVLRGSFGASFDDDAGGLDTHDRVRIGIEAQRDHDVAEVGGDGRQRDPHLTGPQRRVGVGNPLQPQVLDRAVTAHAQPPRSIIGWHQETADGAAAEHPRGVDRPIPQQHLRLADRQNRCYRIGIQGRIGVDEHDSTGMFGLRRPHQSPHRRARQIGDVLPRQRHRASGGHHQRSRPVAGQPRLQHRQHRARRRVYLGHDVTGHRRRFEQHRRTLGLSASSNSAVPQADTDTGCTADDG